MTAIPTREDVEAADGRIGAAVRRTPLLEVGLGDVGIDAKVLLKLELTQHAGSFKTRGALNSILSLADGVSGVCAASGGNHAGAVSWAARRAGLRADVFVPSSATPAKISRIGAYGGVAHLVDGFVKDALEQCRDFAEEHRVPLLHPYDTPETVAGAGTTGLEIEQQTPFADLVLLSCGGGGLYAGTAVALEGRCRVQPVEPELCPSLASALEAGHPVDTAVGGVAADSLGAPRIGEIAFAVAAKQAVDPVLVDETSIETARRFLWESVRVLPEPGACVAFAALLSGRVPVTSDQTVVVVLSGGNNETLPR